MKFLCVTCDEAMGLSDVLGPENGSMTVVFECPHCGHRTAMLTNSAETQVVRSLGVKIGGRTAAAEPMEGIRTSLVTGGAHVRDTLPVGDGEPGANAGSKCPFTGMIEEADERNRIPWTDAARERVERIPVFARRMAMSGVEDYARAQGFAEISEAVLDQARDHLGL